MRWTSGSLSWYKIVMVMRLNLVFSAVVRGWRWVVVVAIMLLALVTIQPPLAAAEPEVTEINLEEGDVLDEAPEVVHMCFSEPVQLTGPGGISDPPWMFNLRMPDGINLGLRIVFEPSGECVDVFPGLPEEPPEGVWTYEWTVPAEADNEDKGSGQINFRVGAGPPLVANDFSDSGGLSTLELVLLIAAGVLVTAALAGFLIPWIGRLRTRE